MTTNTGQRPLSFKRASNLKKLSGQLPGHLQMKRMHPDLFHDDLCRLCGKQTENNLHIWTCTSNLQEQNRKIIIDTYKQSLTKLFNPTQHLREWVHQALEHIPCISTSPIGNGIYPPDRYLFPYKIFPHKKHRKYLIEITTEAQNTTIAQLAAGFFPKGLSDALTAIALTCNEIRYKNSDQFQQDSETTRRSLYPAQKALYEDFHEYYLERNIIQKEWEISENISHAAKRQKNNPKSRNPRQPTTRSLTTKEKQDIRSSKTEGSQRNRELTIKRAMAFVNRRPQHHPHNQFILDRSKKTTTRKIKTGIRGLKPNQSPEGKKAEIMRKMGLPALAQTDIIMFEDEITMVKTPTKKRPRKDPPENHGRTKRPRSD